MVPFIYQDENWLAVNKPTGINTHAAWQGDTGIVEWLQLHLNQKVGIISRLDQGTSGILLFAKTASAKRAAQQIHDRQKAVKTYRFISNKRYRQNSKPRKTWQRNDALDGKKCQTSFRYLESGNGYHCYQAEIYGGRTHQIRRHAALSGVPVLGDSEYGGKNFARLCLHCLRISWPAIDEALVIDQPDSFSLLLNKADALELETSIAWERRLGWPQQISNSYRLMHRGESSLPVTIDHYDNFLLITGFDELSGNNCEQQRFAPVLDYLKQKVPYRGVVLRYHLRNPHQNTLIHHTTCWGEDPGEQRLAEEHGLVYGIHLVDAKHTGLFLDQRDSRRRIFNAAKGKRVANLFSFTCSFSVAALAGGAEVVFSVDLAGSTLNRGKENFTYNDLSRSGRGKFIQEDVMKWLKRQANKLATQPETFQYWDLIICDPPVFASSSKGNTFHVEKQWSELTRKIRNILADDGQALFANNHQGGKASHYERILQQYFSKVTRLSPPLDFPSLAGKPDHVRIYWCQV